MTAPYRAHADPPRTLTERVRRLNDNLRQLAARLKGAIASAVGSAVAEAVEDGVSGLLGGEGTERRRDDHGRAPPGRHVWGEEDDQGYDAWGDGDERGWPAPPKPARRADARWKEAARAAAQAGLWWLRRQPARRPVLTAALVALAAGSAAFVAGPTLAACVGVVASVAGLLMTSDSASAAAELLGAT